MLPKELYHKSNLRESPGKTEHDLNVLHIKLYLSSDREFSKRIQLEPRAAGLCTNKMKLIYFLSPVSWLPVNTTSSQS